MFSLILIIVVTSFISYHGLQNLYFFDQYKFNVNAVRFKKEYIRLLSSGFLHGDFMHLILNMYVLYMFGAVVIGNFGILVFFLVYLGAIVLGNLFSLYVYKNQGGYSAIGASGGVAGIIFLSVAIDPVGSRIGIIFLPGLSIPGYIFGFLYFAYSVYNMLYPSRNDMIGHAAHLGGAVFGLTFAVVVSPLTAFYYSFYLLIMGLPLFYLFYDILIKKRRR
ncbi:MAG: rhomboid family intramembrane serine protease [Bergeyella sp.]|nr:rhomboid family intramembrane serine protease [Bergeyella sp.]